jgi:hypothetical protein
MTETKETLVILKARWPEVTLIISLNALVLLYNKLILRYNFTTTPLQKLIDFAYLLFFVIITELFIIGFQRTIYLNGQARQSPLVLLREGKHFLGRMIGFGLMYELVYMILAWLTFLAIKQLYPIETGFWKAAKVSPFIYQMCFATAALILIKPLLFIFPSIIVLDCRISQSFKLLKQYKLFGAKELVILYLILIAVEFLCVFLPSIYSTTTILQLVLAIAKIIMQQFIWLMIAVMAIRFVASRNLIYDNGSKPLDSLNPSI